MKSKQIELEDLLEMVENVIDYEMTDDHLKEIGMPTRNDLYKDGAIEVSDGVFVLPVEWVCPYLQELDKLRDEV